MEDFTNNILKNLGLPDSNLPIPELMTFYKDLENRVIWMDQDVDETILEISKLIINFNREDDDKNIPVENRQPIKLLIYSYGGDGNACFSLLDIIALSKTPVYTINMGVAMSAGLILLLAGHKRFCLKHSTALIHSGSGGTSGTYEQTEAQMKDYKRFVDQMKSFILERTDIDQKTFNKYKGKEWFVYSDYQVKYHIVDAILTDINEII